MWTKLRLKNFRLFKDTGDIELAPLTFFIGPNSSGKSTLLKSLILLKETLIGGPGASLLLKTTEEDFGSWRDIIYCGNDKLNLEIELSWSRQDGIEEEYSYLGKWKKNGFIGGSYKIDGKSIIKVDKVVSGYKIKSEGSKEYLLKNWKPISFYLLSESLVHDNVDSRKVFFRELELTTNLKNTVHLGPLRKPTELLFSKTRLESDEVGLLGEFTAEHLTKRPVKQVTNQWTSKLGIAEKIEVKGLGNDKFAIMVKTPCGVSSYLNHVGFGVSHILPVLVGGIVLPEHGTMLIEEPEIHLNPKIQVELSDFFIEETNDEMAPKQFIIETHSDHLLSRVRTRIAERKLDRSRVEIYFCDDQGVITRLKINEFGQIANWPRGFFFEDLNETMKQSKAMFSRKKKTK